MDPPSVTHLLQVPYRTGRLVPEGNFRIGSLRGHRPRRRGSRTSRSASPSMLNPNTAALMASPGQIESQGDWSMKARPVPLSMEPQVGNGGGTPYPRNDNVDSASMAVPNCVVASTMIAADTLGTTHVRTMCRWPAPTQRADSTYGRSRMAKTALRTTRDVPGASSTPRTSVVLHKPGPRIATSDTSRTSAGNEIQTSTSRWNNRSN